MNLLPVVGGMIGVVAGVVSGEPLRGALIGAALVGLSPPPYACAGPPTSIMLNFPYKTFLPFSWIWLGASIGVGAGAGASIALWALATAAGALSGVVALIVDEEIMTRQCRLLRNTYGACLEVTNGWTEERAKEYTEGTLSRLPLSRIIHLT